MLGPYDAVSIGEAFGVEVADIPKFTDVDREELSMIFQFDLIRLGHPHWRQQPFTWPQFKRIVTDMDAVAGAHRLEHELPRATTTTRAWCRSSATTRPSGASESAKALATWNLTQRATPFIYQGDEIGMTNYPFTSIEQYDDVEVRGLWRALVETGKVPADELLAHLAQTSRDHSRTPMQWTADPHGGFTTGTPWLAVNPNHTEVNAGVAVGRPRLGVPPSPPAHRPAPRAPGARARRLPRPRPRAPDGVRIHPLARRRDRAGAAAPGHGDPIEYTLPEGLAIAGAHSSPPMSQPPPGSTTVTLAGWHASIHVVAWH